MEQRSGMARLPKNRTCLLIRHLLPSLLAPVLPVDRLVPSEILPPGATKPGVMLPETEHVSQAQT